MILSKNLLETMKSLVKGGITRNGLVQVLNISQINFQHWKTKAEKALLRERSEWSKNDELYVEFYQLFQSGRAINVAKALENIQKDESWQSSAWYLERTLPTEFGKTTRVDLIDLDAQLSKHWPEVVVNQVIDILAYYMENGLTDEQNRMKEMLENKEDDQSSSVTQVSPEEYEKVTGEKLKEPLEQEAFLSEEERATNEEWN